MAAGGDPAAALSRQQDARRNRLPEIVHAILAGTLQKSVSMETLRKELPVRWADQKKLFGVE